MKVCKRNNVLDRTLFQRVNCHKLLVNLCFLIHTQLVSDSLFFKTIFEVEQLFTIKNLLDAADSAPLDSTLRIDVWRHGLLRDELQGRVIINLYDVRHTINMVIIRSKHFVHIFRKKIRSKKKTYLSFFKKIKSNQIK